MRKANKICMVMLIMLGLCSCGARGEMNTEEYIRFMEKEGNGFRKQVKTGDLTYTFQYKDPEYVMLKERKNSVDVPQRMHQLDSTVWFNVMVNTGNSINPLKADAADLNEYNKRVDYFLTKAAKNFRLTYGDKGEMQCIGYFFENNYGLTPMDVMIIGYRIPDKRAVKDIQLEYDDELFNYGPIKVAISAEKLTSIPKLKS